MGREQNKIRQYIYNIMNIDKYSVTICIHVHTCNIMLLSIIITFYSPKHTLAEVYIHVYIQVWTYVYINYIYSHVFYYIFCMLEIYVYISNVCYRQICKMTIKCTDLMTIQINNMYICIENYTCYIYVFIKLIHCFNINYYNNSV